MSIPGHDMPFLAQIQLEEEPHAREMKALRAPELRGKAACE
jgi:hypothetical protein